MKGKILAVACATIFTFLGASCSDKNGWFAEKNETSFVVRCDYGKHVQGKATYLLNDSLIFFNLDEYDVEELILGDVVTVEYTGELTVQETYPSGIVIDGTIKEISVDEAEIVQVKYDGVRIVEDGDKKENYTFEDVPQYVIKDRTGAFVALEEVQAGTSLYATYREDGVSGKKIILDGLYAYRPRK